MNFFSKQKRRLSLNKEALLFNAGSMFDYFALFFLISTAIEKAYNRQVPTYYEYGFIAVTLFSWLLGLPYEWKLRWARYVGVIYVLSMVLILCIYLSIGLPS